MRAVGLLPDGMHDLDEFRALSGLSREAVRNYADWLDWFRDFVEQEAVDPDAFDSLLDRVERAEGSISDLGDCAQVAASSGERTSPVRWSGSSGPGT